MNNQTMGWRKCSQPRAVQFRGGYSPQFFLLEEIIKVLILRSKRCDLRIGFQLGAMFYCSLLQLAPAHNWNPSKNQIVTQFQSQFLKNWSSSIHNFVSSLINLSTTWSACLDHFQNSDLRSVDQQGEVEMNVDQILGFLLYLLPTNECLGHKSLVVPWTWLVTQSVQGSLCQVCDVSWFVYTVNTKKNMKKEEKKRKEEKKKKKILDCSLC